VPTIAGTALDGGTALHAFAHPTASAHPGCAPSQPLSMTAVLAQIPSHTKFLPHVAHGEFVLND
jgi:hypothetical protein